MEAAAETSKRWLDTSKPLVFVFLLAFVVRLAYLLEAAAEPWFGYPVLDSQYVINQARYLVEHGTLPPGPFFRPPLYTWFLAAIIAIAGDLVVFFAPLLQYLMGAGFCVLMFAITRTCWSAGAGMIAGALAALYSPLVFFETELLSDAMALFFYAAFLAAWLRARKIRSWKMYVGAGALAGLGCITRPNLVLCVAAFAGLSVVLDWLFARRASSGEHWIAPLAKQLAAFLIPVAIITAIPSAMNWKRGDFNFIASQGGVNFWIGNHAKANGTNIIIPFGIEIPGEEYRDMIEEVGILFYLQEKHGAKEGFRLYHEDRQSAPKPSELSKFWYAKGKAWLFRNPAAATRLYAKKLIALFADYEIRNNRQFTFMRENISTVLKLLPFTMGWLVAGACGGIVAISFAWRRGFFSRCEPLIWVVVYSAIAAVSVLMFFVAGRLRLPVLPGLFILSGIGVLELTKAFHQKRLGVGAVIAVAMTVGATLSFSNWKLVDFRYLPTQPTGLGLPATSNQSMEWTMLAKASLAKGRPKDAIRYSQKALQLDPHFAYAGLIIGDAALMLGDVDTAGAGYRLAHENEPQSSKAINNLAVVAEKRGQLDAAASLYQHSIQKNPFHPPSLGNYAILLARAGQTSQSLALAQRALVVDPGNRAAAAVTEELANSPPSSDAVVSELRAEVRKPIPPPSAIQTPLPLDVAVQQAAPGRFNS